MDNILRKIQIDREEREKKEAKKLQDIIDDREEARGYTQLEHDDLIKLINQVMSRNIIDDMLDDGYIPMIYNGCYGGPGMSVRAGTLWGLIHEEFKNNIKFKKFGDMADNFLNSFIEAKVINFLGDKANEKCSEPIFDFIKIEVYKFINTKEYDGMESLRFDKNRYVSDTMKDILKDTTISNDKKIFKMTLLINKDIINQIIYPEEIENRVIKKLPPILSIIETLKVEDIEFQLVNRKKGKKLF
jgi:hypothetical protein